MSPTFPNSPYNKYYHFYNNTARKSPYFKPEEYFSHKKSAANTDNANFLSIDKSQYYEKEKNNTNTAEISAQQNRSSGFNFNFLNFENIFSNNSDEPVFEIMGIKLYLDDLLILGLLFILYTEGVKDELLFLALVLLLIG